MRHLLTVAVGRAVAFTALVWALWFDHTVITLIGGLS